MNLDLIKTPTLLLDKSRTLNNIQSMVSKCDSHGIELRPHFKTHQSLEVGSWFRQSGINKITVSSLKMARYFASDGWSDILIAFPFNPREIEDIQKLAQEIDLTIIVPCLDSAAILSELCTVDVSVMIKIDTGYGRSGVAWNDISTIKAIVSKLDSNSNIHLCGILTHSGHTYKARGSDSIDSIYNETVGRMQECKKALGNKDLIISVGDTPSASIVKSFKGVDELRPGNFVYYDFMQYVIGSCSLNNISVALACPIVDISKDRKKAVIYGGGVHLSKESIIYKGKTAYGLPVELNENGWTMFEKDILLSGLSQEHGVIESEEPLPEEIKVGGLLGILPVHSCLTADLMAGYTLFSGDRVDHLNKPMNGSTP